MPKALIIYPKTPPTYWSFNYALRFVGKKAAYPPLGVLTIASFFPKEWEVTLIDQNVKKLRARHIENADVVFIGAMNVQEASVVEDIERAKKLGKKTILGGPIVSTRTPATKLADCRVEGEAETIMPLLLKDLEEDTLKEHYVADEKPMLDNVPLPRLDLIDLKKYNSMAIQFSRGCPFDCEFCDITKIFGRKPRVKPVNNLLAELDQLYDLKWRGAVFLVDDNFIGNQQAIRELLPRMIEWQKQKDYPFNLVTEASMNISDDILELMIEAGFRKLFVGIETPVEESLRETGKFQNLKISLLEKVKKIQQRGVEVMSGFICGFDNDPDDITERQEEFIKKSGIALAMVGLLGAVPGTRLYQRLKKEGRILHKTTGNNTDGSLNFISKIDRKKLMASYKTLMQKLYSSEAFYKRATIFLERAKDAMKVGHDHYSLKQKLTVLAKSIIKQGIIDKERKHYWKYVFNVVRHHRKRFGDAVTLAIMGYHLRKVTNLSLNN